MDENDQNLEDLKPEIKPGSGSLLAAERKNQQQSVEDIARELNLSITQIRAIESDQSEGLPEPTYVRGYIRSYAKLLGLNPDEILKSYLNADWRKGSNLDDLPKGIASATSGKSFSFGLGKIITLLILLGLGGFLYFSGALNGLLKSNEVSVAESVNESSVPAAIRESTPISIEVSGMESEGSDLSSATSGEAGVVQIENSEDPRLNKNELTLSFSETSWVDIRDEQDIRLAYQSYPKGERLTVSSETPMSVFIGNAAGVTVQYNGAAFDITEFSQGVYAKFIVGE